MIHHSIRKFTPIQQAIARLVKGIIYQANYHNENLAMTDKIEVVKVCEQLNILNQKLEICHRQLKDILTTAGTLPPESKKTDFPNIHTGINLDDITDN